MTQPLNRCGATELRQRRDKKENWRKNNERGEAKKTKIKLLEDRPRQLQSIWGNKFKQFPNKTCVMCSYEVKTVLTDNIMHVCGSFKSSVDFHSNV
ncbi:CLUMA_CG008772, isoform A [Clunio marinus]|uniref:CLUMA_CG008772, isoform A n=1 Tax=Clunio marinus TaxID=568069 RepID=A0A1J1I6V1_9DIPT|nr:CLUMA_CG008772, isoform A [Clunio marinus]